MNDERAMAKRKDKIVELISSALKNGETIMIDNLPLEAIAKNGGVIAIEFVDGGARIANAEELELALAAARGEGWNL